MTDLLFPVLDKPLNLYNTETRQKQTLKPLEGNTIRMYTCGPTVYNYAHIGNFRTYIFEDLLRRTIKFFGMNIIQVMNLTDVDDKTIAGAIKNNTSLDAFTQVYKEAFFDDLKTLNIEKVEHYPAATDYIQEMIAMIQTLLEKEFAYKGTDGSIYYGIEKFKRYGCLSHFHLDELKLGASKRVSHDEYDKDNAADFVLWKAYDPERDGLIFWESPYGRGRPGWHLECSAMAMKILGDTIDIHVGGVDNMFPHHENEIAQSEACSGQKFSKLWMHSEHLLVDNKKMSKSLGNFFTLRDLINKGYTGRQVRYMLLQTHYKTQLNFTFTGLDAVKNSLQRIQDFIQRLEGIKHSEEVTDVNHILKGAFFTFTESLADDLNISLALASLFDLIREINTLCDADKIGRIQAGAILQFLKQINEVLGILSFNQLDEQIPKELEEALIKRVQARENKDWKLSDSLRDFITNRGYVIEDTAHGARLKKIE